MSIDWSLEKARLLRKFPWFGALSMYLEYEDDPDCSTAWTDGDKVGANPAFWAKLSQPEREFVMAHEVMHVALSHCNTWRQGPRDPAGWNEAGDHVINLLLEDARMVLWPQCLHDPKFKGMSTEEVYNELAKDRKNNPGNQGKPGKPGKGAGKPGSGPGRPDDGPTKPGCGAGDVKPSSKTKGESGEKEQQKWIERMVRAAEAAKTRGNLPGGVESFLKKLLYPQIPWTTYLSRLATEAVPEDWDWMKFDRRWVGQGLYFPSQHTLKAKGAVILDTSGSMSDKDLLEGMSETWGVLESRMVKELRIIQCDAGVHSDLILTPEDDLDLKVIGRGGTDFRPAFKALEEWGPKFIIVFTDTDGSMPEEAPGCPVWWITRNPRAQVPFGEIIHM